MSSLHIPRWVGPVLTPILLILFIGLFCCYYCYWKPKRQRRKEGKTSTSMIKTMAAPKHTVCQVKYMNEDCYYDYNTPDYSYGPFYTDICPVSNGLAYCKPKEYQPRKVFYYQDNPTRSLLSCQKSCKKQCPVANAKMPKCKVKCQKGHCMKCPDLPIIAEGDSIVEVEENESLKCLESEEVGCNCNVESPDKVVVVECEGTVSDSSNGSSNGTVVGHDSGYED